MSSSQTCDRPQPTQQMAERLSETLEIVSELGNQLDSLQQYQDAKIVEQFLWKLNSAACHLANCRVLLIKAISPYVLSVAISSMLSEE